MFRAKCGGCRNIQSCDTRNGTPRHPDPERDVAEGIAHALHITHMDEQGEEIGAERAGPAEEMSATQERWGAPVVPLSEDTRCGQDKDPKSNANY